MKNGPIKHKPPPPHQLVSSAFNGIFSTNRLYRAVPQEYEIYHAGPGTKHTQHKTIHPTKIRKS